MSNGAAEVERCVGEACNVRRRVLSNSAEHCADGACVDAETAAVSRGSVRALLQTSYESLYALRQMPTLAAAGYVCASVVAVATVVGGVYTMWKLTRGKKKLRPTTSCPCSEAECQP